MSLSNYVLTLTPRGRDASVAGSLLSELGLESRSMSNIHELVESLSNDVSLLLVTQEELDTSDLRGLDKWLREQPAWADLPTIVLTYAPQGDERALHATRLLGLLRNVTFLERPFHPTTFASVVKAAASARARQYEARDRMQELAESQESLRTALLAGNLGAWELDLGSRTLKASDTCKGIFGRKPHETFGYQQLLDSIDPDFRAQMQQSVETTIHTGADYQIEYKIIWPDGTDHWVEIHGRRIVDENGHPIRLVGVSTDVTARKTIQDQLLRLNESLEQRVAERTTALERAHEHALQEVEQRKKAEALLVQAQKVETIGQLTGGVAHDFNNLLMAVLGTLEVLKRHVGPDQRALRLIEGALEGARRGASLTQRLLAFARRQELEVGRHDLGSILISLEPLLKQSVGANIDLSIRQSAQGMFSDIDANQVELALLNLVVNARDAMPNGGTITIEAQRVEIENDPDLDGSYYEISVRDTGVGMDAETLRRAIEPFYSTKGVGKGTGLGLSMIHGLMIQLGGGFRLTSEQGLGTRASLLFPVSNSGSQPATAQVEATGGADQQVAHSTILIVDDDPLIAMSTAAMVEDLGHTVIEAYSGAEALEILGGGTTVDLMITDFSMPKMTGAELIVAVRAIRPKLPIILASGYAELPGGVDLQVQRLNKPYDEKQLSEQIDLAFA